MSLITDNRIRKGQGQGHRDRDRDRDRGRGRDSNKDIGRRKGSCCPGVHGREHKMMGELTALLPAVSADLGELRIFLSHKKLAVHPTHKKELYNCLSV